MASMMNRGGPQLEIDREMVEVSTALPQPDPNWTYTDDAGHEHAYGSRETPYPTLVERQGEPYWCPDCEDEHVDTWLECPLCGQKIQPGTYIDTSPMFIPGLTSYRIDGREVSQEEGEALLARMRQAQEAQERTRALETAKKAARLAEAAMVDEGLSPDQIQRVVNRMVHGRPDGSDQAQL